MKLMNIENIDYLFELIDKCEGEVSLVSDEGDSINMKSQLAKFFATAKIFSSGECLKQMELKFEKPADQEIILNALVGGTLK